MLEEPKTIPNMRAFLAAGVKNYSLLMVDDEPYAIRKMKEYRTRMSNLIRVNSGRILEAGGDDLLAEFSSAEDAVQCAVGIQNALKARNAELPVNNRLNYGIGIDTADADPDDGRPSGAGKLAARIEELSDPGSVLISHTIFDQIKEKLTYGYRDLGHQNIENMGEPVRVYKILTDPKDAGKFIGESDKPFSRKVLMVVAAILLVIGLAIAAGIL